MKFERQRMVQWYDVRQLASTGLKTVVSSIFGNFADKRELQAAINHENSFDYSRKDELWVDYISDLGDGFNSTYTMAHLLAQEKLLVNGKSLTRGDILVMGGDEVYPTPEKREYENRLQGPYNAANPWNEGGEHQHVFALPGNHDWYDGLSNFIKLFCQGRALGNWHTQQKRSYFAFKLPHGYWIWGIDVQLSSDIDKPQMDYFDQIGKKMSAGDKVILCTAEPAWVYNSVKKNDLSYNRLAFFEDKYIHAKKLHHVATLTGDLHHYSHYAGTDKVYNEEQHLITAGGGGAFMHPTHFLKDQITVNKIPFQLKAKYPSKGVSQKLAFLNFFFPVLNWRMPIALGFFLLITTWFLQGTTKAMDKISFMEYLSHFELSFRNIPHVLDYIRKSLAHNPTVLLCNMVLTGGIIAFTDTSFGKHRWNLLAGIPHALIQLASLYLLIWIFSRLNLYYYHLYVENPTQVVLFTAEIVLLGGLLTGTIFGIYLAVCSLIFKSHPTEAFSSLRWTGYKNFLKMHITKEGVTIYPIGVKKVVKNWTNTGTEDKPKFSGDAIQCALIEEPFTLK